MPFLLKRAWNRHIVRASNQFAPSGMVCQEPTKIIMKKWPARESIFISRCFWDYYLHVFQKLYATELASNHMTKVTWFDPPTRNPLTWLRNRKRVIDGITVRRPFSLRNEYERFRVADQTLFLIQLRSSIRKQEKPDLWSVACATTLAYKNEFIFQQYILAGRLL